MGRLWFCGKWIQWIKACLESATVSVLVNGSPTKEFKPTRGLRQGDPMTPFLFLIVAQGLAGLVNQATRKNLLSGIKVGDKKVEVNLLQFADDTLFVCEPNMQNIKCIEAILGSPIGVCKEITKLQRKFLWGWGTDGKKIAWTSWENICKAKEEGGLGIKRIDLFNKTLLAKWLWRWCSTERGLWKEVLESKYGARGLLNSIAPKRNRYTSRWWNDLLKVNLFDQGDNWFNQNMTWEVGSGEKIKFWEDEWLANGQLKGRYKRLYNNSELKDKPIGSCGSWNVDG
ncbi:uncharacterized protein [Phaseolus vulgaris]|uniref:uncharacterized protein n=1 Tax=Phaseolus vulgaris TaxID=3885 RepID=UPI0035CC0BDF